jgi:hypothetical protein
VGTQHPAKPRFVSDEHVPGSSIVKFPAFTMTTTSRVEMCAPENARQDLAEALGFMPALLNVRIGHPFTMTRSLSTETVAYL